MGKFATNKNGNIDSGTEVLANNMTFLQQTKAESISNLFGDLFDEGILSGFELSANADGTFNIGIGIGYKKDVNSGMYNRIAILEETDYHNELFGDSTYPDGRGINQKTNTGILGEYVDTPKSTGCLNIPIPNATIIYYIDLRFLNVCDNGNNGDGLGLTNYSIAKNIVPSTDKRKRFYKWVDGYDIELVQNISEIQGICLGTVQKAVNNTITFTNANKTPELLIKSKIIMDYFTEGSGITITEQEGKKKLSVNVDNVTTEIRDNKVRLTEDALYPYHKFIVNSGNTNISGEANILVTDGIGINLYFGSQDIPLVVSPSYNDKYTILPTDIIEKITNARTDIFNYYSEVANGNYIICINNTDKDNNNILLEHPKLEIMKGFSISRVAPSIQKGKLWLDISKAPYQVKWYNGGQWLQYHGVRLGAVNITNSAMTVVSYKFNTLILDNVILDTVICEQTDFTLVNDQIISLRADDEAYLNLIGGEGFKFNNNPIPRLPDYSSMVHLYGSDDSQTKTIANNGWLHIQTTPNSTAYFAINGKSIVDDSWNTGDQKVIIFPVKAGDSISFRYTVVSFFPYR